MLSAAVSRRYRRDKSRSGLSASLRAILAMLSSLRLLIRVSARRSSGWIRRRLHQRMVLVLVLVFFSGVHQAAALMVGRRGLGLGLYRRFGSGPVASCVTSPVCCPDRCENPADGLGSGDACGGAAVSGSVRTFRKRRDHRSGAASDRESNSSGEGLFAHAVGRVARSHRPCR